MPEPLPRGRRRARARDVRDGAGLPHPAPRTTAPDPASRAAPRISLQRAVPLRRLLPRILATLLLLAPFAIPVPALAADAVVPDHEARSSEGAEVRIDLLSGSTGVADGTARLLLDGLPAGSTLTADGKRAIVPGQGTWDISEDGATATFRPAGTRIGRQPTPILYTAQDSEGRLAEPAVITVTTPMIPDLIRAAPYGEPFTLPVGEEAQNVRDSTLTLVPLAGESGIEITEDGTKATVPGQGTWTLDREARTVTFTPESADVHRVAPMGLRGQDDMGHEAAPGLMIAGYPGMLDSTIAAETGIPVQFTPMDGSRHVRADSIRLQREGRPAGSVLTEDGRTLQVPGEGTWSIDVDGRTVTFTPEPGLTGSPTPVSISATGLYADAATGARLTVQYGDATPTARDDQLWVRPGETVSVDLLADDGPGSAARPLDPSSIRLRSLDASNLDELDNGTGRRIVVPGEGTYAVREDGVLTFTPATGFVGRTTPIQYTVADSGGLVAHAQIAVYIDPAAAPPSNRPEETSGLSGVLRTLLPADRATFAEFVTVAALLTFSGLVALWIGARMESDRRSWNG